MLIKLTKENYRNMIDKMVSDKLFSSDNKFLFHIRFLSVNEIETYAYDNDIIITVIESDINENYYELKYITKFDKN
jgi:hypothetical protein